MHKLSLRASLHQPCRVDGSYWRAVRGSQKNEPLGDFDWGNHNLVAMVFYGEKFTDSVQAGLEKREIS